MTDLREKIAFKLRQGYETRSVLMSHELSCQLADIVLDIPEIAEALESQRIRRTLGHSIRGRG